jgi:HSP20 family protein
MAKQQPPTQQIPRNEAASAPLSEPTRAPEANSSPPNPGRQNWEARGEPSHSAQQAANAAGELSKTAIRTAEAASAPLKRELERASEHPLAMAPPILPIMRRWSEEMDQMFSEFFGGRVTARPFSMMRRLGEDVDQMFSEFFGGAGGLRTPALGEAWWPPLDVFRSNGKYIIQADVPGLKRDDIEIEVRDDQLVISGQRRSETQSNKGDYMRNERSYGSFFRSVPLPAGAKAESASATFENGVLRIEIEAAPEKPRGRRVEIRPSAAH